MKFQFVNLVFLELSDLTVASALGTFLPALVVILRIIYPTKNPLSKLLDTFGGKLTFPFSSCSPTWFSRYLCWKLWQLRPAKSKFLQGSAFCENKTFNYKR